jgi:hypothetical protein
MGEHKVGELVYNTYDGLGNIVGKRYDVVIGKYLYHIEWLKKGRENYFYNELTVFQMKENLQKALRRQDGKEKTKES